MMSNRANTPLTRHPKNTLKIYRAFYKSRQVINISNITFKRKIIMIENDVNQSLSIIQRINTSAKQRSAVIN